MCFGVLQLPSRECGSCGPNTYMQPNISDQCISCPEGLTSPPGSVGIISCVCPAGAIAMITQDTFSCSNCPVGTFSSTAGAVCTRCPEGLTTMSDGATSLSKCVCPTGRRRYQNTCV